MWYAKYRFNNESMDWEYVKDSGQLHLVDTKKHCRTIFACNPDKRHYLEFRIFNSHDKIHQQCIPPHTTRMRWKAPEEGNTEKENTVRIDRLFKEQKLGLKRSTIATRVQRGWTDHQIIITPLVKSKPVPKDHPLKTASYIRMMAKKLHKARK